MRIELHKHRKIEIEDDGSNTYTQTAEKFESIEDIEYGLDVCLECVDIIRNLIDGLELDVFMKNRAVIDRCAINFLVTGNQL